MPTSALRSPQSKLRIASQRQECDRPGDVELLGEQPGSAAEFDCGWRTIWRPGYVLPELRRWLDGIRPGFWMGLNVAPAGAELFMCPRGRRSGIQGHEQLVLG